MSLPHILSDLYKYLCESIAESGAQSSDMDARIMLLNRAGVEWSDIIARPEASIDSKALKAIQSDLERRLAGEPLSRIYGTRGFWGLEFAISPETLDPRPDTEVLVEAALDRFSSCPPKTILDLGTGSGCILLSLLTEWPEARGVGVDISDGALAMAQKNAKAHGVLGRCAFHQGSWGGGIDEKFDLVVSNPPYISNQVIPTLSKEVQNHDPILALDGGADGLQAYRDIFSQLFELVNPCGKAFFEIGCDQEESVVRLAEESGFLDVHVHHDLAGLPRVVEISSGDK